MSLGKWLFIWERLGVCHLPSACLTLPTGDSSFSPEDDLRNEHCTAESWVVGNELTQPAALELWHWARVQNNKKVLLTCCLWTLSTNESLLCSNSRTLIMCLIKISHHFSESNGRGSKEGWASKGDQSAGSRRFLSTTHTQQSMDFLLENGRA